MASDVVPQDVKALFTIRALQSQATVLFIFHFPNGKFVEMYCQTHILDLTFFCSSRNELYVFHRGTKGSLITYSIISRHNELSTSFFQTLSCSNSDIRLILGLLTVWEL